jgi:PAS domain S-box-containing protein
MTRVMVTANAVGVPTALVPLPMLWYLARRFPTKNIVTAYDHATNRALVNFPGWDAPAVQYVLDELSAPPIGRYAEVAPWPAHSSDRHENSEAPSRRGAAPEPMQVDEESPARSADAWARGVEPGAPAEACRPGPDPATDGARAQMRALMEGLSALQQERLSDLVCELKSTLAAERLCFHQLFEVAPDGYVATDLDGNIQHANEAMYQWLRLKAPRLEGMPLLMFFTPCSKAVVGQCLRLLSTGAYECQPFAEVHARIALGDEHAMPVSMRLIPIAAADAVRSTIRWLIRDVSDHRSKLDSLA